MQTISHTQLIESLNWRYATKIFDPHRKIPNEIWSALEDTLVLTPSSFGLQPWKFLVLTQSPLREQLVPHSWGQRQVADASHLVVFTIQKKIDETWIDRFLDRIVELRKISKDSLAGYRQMMVGHLITGNRSSFITEWASRQAYIALGNFMTAASLLGIDTCPLEGIDPAKYDEILRLSSRGLSTVVACVAGYRSSNDKYAQLAKVRFEKSQVVESVDEGSQN